MFSFENIHVYWNLRNQHPDLERNIYRVLSKADAKSVNTAITDVELYKKYKELVGSPIPMSIYPKNNCNFHDFTYLMGGLNSVEMDEMPIAPAADQPDDNSHTRGYKYYIVSPDYYTN